ncbi:MAG: hypothetical protein IJG33_07655 [Selenomonadaceae bacterium]|nr:hypothetical protein [Selenomonadaceae bacterium]MBR0288130.1 hypothetical protein [Selenomonadaceae bacterium]
MSKKTTGISKKLFSPSKDKYQISILLDPKDVEDIKALAIAQDSSLSSVIVSMMREGLSNEKHQKVIQAYKQFKSSLE